METTEAHSYMHIATEQPKVELFILSRLKRDLETGELTPALICADTPDLHVQGESSESSKEQLVEAIDLLLEYTFSAKS